MVFENCFFWNGLRLHWHVLNDSAMRIDYPGTYSYNFKNLPVGSTIFFRITNLRRLSRLYARAVRSGSKSDSDAWAANRHVRTPSTGFTMISGRRAVVGSGSNRLRRLDSWAANRHVPDYGSAYPSAQARRGTARANSKHRQIYVLLVSWCFLGHKSTFYFDDFQVQISTRIL
jgi:hypothetical protein